MQQFHGEDLNYAQRIKVQQEELRQWSAELIASKANRDEAEKAANELYAERAMQVDQVKSDLEATARMARTQQAVAVAEYQLAQAAAKREREAAAQKAELQDNIEEIQNNLAGDILTENPAVGRSFMAPNRVRPDHYKGMSPHEQQAILQAQEAQRAQKQAADAAAKARTRQSTPRWRRRAGAGAYQDAQVAAMRADMRKSIRPRTPSSAKSSTRRNRSSRPTCTRTRSMRASSTSSAPPAARPGGGGIRKARRAAGVAGGGDGGETDVAAGRCYGSSQADSQRAERHRVRRRRAGISRAMTGSAGRVCVRVCASRDAYWLIPEHMSDS